MNNMNWEYVNEYAWETMGQVRRTPLPRGYDAVADREANTLVTQTDKSWTLEVNHE